MKAIAAFWNTDGGRLYLGVSDDGTIAGLGKDYSTFRKETNQDGYRRAMMDRVDNEFSEGRIMSPMLEVSMIRTEGKEVCRIDAPRGKDPAYLRANKNGLQVKKFFVRRDNSSQDLNDDVEAIAKYIRNPF